MSLPIVLSRTTVNGVEYAASMPARGSTGAAGYDLAAYLPDGTFRVKCVQYGKQSSDYADVYETIFETSERMDHIPPGARALIPTGIQMAIPNGEYGRVAPRSGLAWCAGIDVMAGVIDSDYRGDIGVVLVNLSGNPIVVKHGDRIAQLVFERIGAHTFATVDSVAAMTQTQRGAAGYGSTDHVINVEEH